MSDAELTPTERALVDLVRVALSGDVNGASQLCRRLIRRPPAVDGHAAILKAELIATLESVPKAAGTPLRDSLASVPAELEEDEVSWVQYPRPVESPIYSAEVAEAIGSLIAEHASPERLEPYGLAPSRAVLFTGPPGVGKTLSAAYIASRLSLPLVTLNLASLISSFMGRTGQNLQDILSRARRQPCVLFLDEFDALAKSRDDNSDVGEVKRLVNVLLQQLDNWPHGSLLIAATNHPKLLDPAVNRRFDSTIQFKLPALSEREAYISGNDIIARASMSGDEVEMLAIVSDGWSSADMQNWINHTTRRAVVNFDGEPTALESIDLAGALLEDAKRQAQRWASQSPANRAQAAALASNKLGWSQRRIAEWLGVSHVTIGKDLNRSHKG